MAGRIHVGVGGWTYEPWRDNFYPRGLSHARELAYAAQRLTAIEINGTFYGTQKRASFARWRDETPEGFVFSMKANRFATQRRVLAEAGESVRRFVDSGIAELGDKLGPIVWQFAPTKRFDPDDFEAFLQLLPRQVEGLPLRHAMDVRHDSFRCPEWLALARRYGVATVFTDSDDYPPIPDATADFIYLREMRTQSALAAGVPADTLPALADCLRLWAAGAEPEGLPRVQARPLSAAPARDVFCYFISGAKERAPAAAMALLATLEAR